MQYSDIWELTTPSSDMFYYMKHSIYDNLYLQCLSLSRGFCRQLVQLYSLELTLMERLKTPGPECPSQFMKSFLAHSMKLPN
jgi:hypothetical protein